MAEQTIPKSTKCEWQHSLASQFFLSHKNMEECDSCSFYFRDQNIIYILCMSIGQISIKLLRWSGTRPVLIPCPGLMLTLMDFTGPDCHRVGLLPSGNFNYNYYMAMTRYYHFHHEHRTALWSMRNCFTSAQQIAPQSGTSRVDSRKTTAPELIPAVALQENQ